MEDVREILNFTERLAFDRRMEEHWYRDTPKYRVRVVSGNGMDVETYYAVQYRIQRSVRMELILRADEADWNVSWGRWDPDHDTFILSPASGGVGVEMAGYDHIPAYIDKYKEYVKKQNA